MTVGAAMAMVERFEEALAVLRAAGPVAVGLWGLLGDTRREMEEVAECHELVCEMAADADAVREIECLTGENLRDQVSVEELEGFQREAERCRGWWKWN